SSGPLSRHPLTRHRHAPRSISPLSKFPHPALPSPTSPPPSSPYLFPPLLSSPHRPTVRRSRVAGACRAGRHSGPWLLQASCNERGNWRPRDRRDVAFLLIQPPGSSVLTVRNPIYPGGA